ncbi:hypothetical protein [Nocardiopsis valliformis]|uniref:hypothetical protein n=1 Tax=Nocardiopsis valliformis TaxID=239974 RepID=UPI00034A8990|nr:hypothetical protein [Nocardiopsis valliformis]
MPPLTGTGPGAAGTATFITVMSAGAATQLDESADAVTTEAGGIHVAFILGAVIATLAFFATFLVRRSEPGQDEESAEGAEGAEAENAPGVQETGAH